MTKKIKEKILDQSLIDWMKKTDRGLNVINTNICIYWDIQKNKIISYSSDNEKEDEWQFGMKVLPSDGDDWNFKYNLER